MDSRFRNRSLRPPNSSIRDLFSSSFSLYILYIKDSLSGETNGSLPGGGCDVEVSSGLLLRNIEPRPVRSQSESIGNANTVFCIAVSPTLLLPFEISVIIDGLTDILDAKSLLSDMYSSLIRNSNTLRKRTESSLSMINTVSCKIKCGFLLHDTEYCIYLQRVKRLQRTKKQKKEHKNNTKMMDYGKHTE